MKNFENKNNKGRGFVQIILLVVAALVLLKYVYKVDVIGFLTQGKPKEFLDQFYTLAAKGWAKYDGAVIKVWDYIIDAVKNIKGKTK